MASDGRSRERGNPIGPTGITVGENVRRIRADTRTTQAELARRLAENGRPIPVASIGRIESGERRVEVDDLVAIAIALGVTPLALLLPDTRLPVDDVELTGWGKLTAQEAWYWAASGIPLVLDGSVEDMESEAMHAHMLSKPWWLDMPYARVTDMSAQQQARMIRVWGVAQKEREEAVDGEHQAAS